MIVKCQGEGQGCCKWCKEMGKYSLTWMSFLYRVEGIEGCYCFEHALEIEKRLNEGD